MLLFHLNFIKTLVLEEAHPMKMLAVELLVTFLVAAVMPLVIAATVTTGGTRTTAATASLAGTETTDAATETSDAATTSTAAATATTAVGTTTTAATGTTGGTKSSGTKGKEQQIWHTILEFDKIETKQTMSDKERLDMICRYIKTLCGRKCHRRNKAPTKCECMSCLVDDDEGQIAVANHILEWAKKKREDRDANFIGMLRYANVTKEMFKSMNTGMKKKEIKKHFFGYEAKPFPLPYVPTDDEDVKNKLKSLKICK